MPGIILAWNVLMARDYGVTENIIIQDNKTKLILESNGKASSGKRKISSTFVFFLPTGSKRGGYKWNGVKLMI